MTAASQTTTSTSQTRAAGQGVPTPPRPPVGPAARPTPAWCGTTAGTGSGTPPGLRRPLGGTSAPDGGDPGPIHPGSPQPTCDIMRRSDHRQCGAPAVVELTLACVHEHIHPDVLVCQLDADAAAAGALICTSCLASAECDDCTLTVAGVRDLEAS